MLRFIDSPPGVMALTMSGKITGEDLTAIMDQLDEVLATEDKVHLFVETQTISGIEISSMPEYLSRAMPLFGKLSRFGRIAVVADQSWIRAGTRLESALVPSVSYRVYMPDEREEALAWVKGSA